MTLDPPFPKLFEPGQIGSLGIRNRIIMPAMATGTSSEEGFVTQQTKDYYEARARGGAGLIIVEFTCVDFPRGKGAFRQLSVDDDRFIPGLKELAQVIQRQGARAALQLHHAGNAARRENTGLQPVGPSAIGRLGGEIPRAFTTEEIRDLVKRFAEAAERAADAGFDGIEIHGAHAYLIAQFLSAAWNRREDRYGGSRENRARILVEIFRAVRERVGKTYPVWCRINGEENGVSGGTTLEEAQATAAMIENVGCDAISVSASARELLSSRPHFFPSGWALHLAEGVKSVVRVPVIAVGRITPELGERVLGEGKVDFIAMGRALRADPDLPRKLSSAKQAEIRPCIVCNACAERLRPGGHRLCAVNPALGREGEYAIAPTRKKKRVLIVGGGPAGMEAARVAGLRGHEVILCEKEGTLGGKLLIAAVPPFKDKIMEFVGFLSARIKALGVRAEVGTEATRGLLESFHPNVVILATGSTPLVPRINGIGRQNVVTAEAVLGHRVDVQSPVAVLGGGQVGCEVAAFLAEKGKKVILVEMLELLAADLGKRQGRQCLIDYLTEKGVTFLTRMKGEEVSEAGLVVVDHDGHRRTIEVDTVVLACGSVPDTSLFEELKGIAPEIHAIGDCSRPRSILEAIDEAARIGRLV